MKKNTLAFLTLLLFSTPAFAEEDYSKVDDYTLKISRTITVEENRTVEELESELAVWQDQLAQVEANYTADVARLNAGITERQARLTEATRLGISKAEEIIPE